MCDIARNLRLKRRAFAEKNGEKEGKKAATSQKQYSFCKKMFETKKLLLLQKNAITVYAHKHRHNHTHTERER
jgi:hypothetical protein